MKELTKYEIRQPRTMEEFEKGLSFLSRSFDDKYGTYPREIPGRFFLAFDKTKNDEVVATISLQTRRPGCPLEVEEYYNVDLSELYAGFKYEVGEVGRLSSVDSYVTPYLFCAVSLFARTTGVKFMICFNKMIIAKLIQRRYKLQVHEHSFPLRTEAIDRKYYPYFFDDNNPVIVLTQHFGCWNQRIMDLMKQGEGVIDIIIQDSPRYFSCYEEQEYDQVEYSRQRAIALQ